MNKSKYPVIIFFGNSTDFFEVNKNLLNCSVNVVNEISDVYKLFDPDYHLLITHWQGESEYYQIINEIIPHRLKYRWIHMESITDVNTFNNSVNFCYMKNIIKNYCDRLPVFSIFTTCYKSYDKILRAYESIKTQNFKDWEWIILDDSPEDSHFTYLQGVLNDPKIRLYRRSENSGNIGNVKNEVVSLCRGKYLIELDHDDSILPNVLLDSVNVFEKYSDVGFIYMDYTNLYEDSTNFNYGNHFSLGYAGYYLQYLNGKWVYVAMTPNINNITLSHIVSVPNHPRIWRKSVLLQIGNYNELLPVSDDYELLLRTAVNTKIARIHKLGYIQYMNNNSNNFSLIRNSEINRLRHHLTEHCYSEYKIDEYLKKENAYEINDDKGQIWKKTNYKHLYCNLLINVDYETQYCIIGLKNLYEYYNKIKELSSNSKNDFILLDNSVDSILLINNLESLNLNNIKCYSMKDCTIQELINYFHLLYRSCEKYYIFT
jgi:glycosyltransferase involved in cell wall biosynthesis